MSEMISIGNAKGQPVDQVEKLVAFPQFGYVLSVKYNEVQIRRSSLHAKFSFNFNTREEAHKCFMFFANLLLDSKESFTNYIKKYGPGEISEGPVKALNDKFKVNFLLDEIKDLMKIKKEINKFVKEYIETNYGTNEIKDHWQE